MKKLPAVFFDLDDTLYDFHQATREELVLRLSRLLGEAETARLTEALDAYEAIREETWQEYLQGRLPFPQVRVARFERVLSALRMARPAEQVQAEADAFISGWLQRIRPFPEVAPLLDALQGQVRLGVITNGEPEQTVTKLSLLGLRGRFDPAMVIASMGVGVAKPDPAIFRLALERAGERPDRAVMAGDNLEADVYGALGAGWAGAVWLRRKREDPLPKPPADPAQRLRVADGFGPLAQAVGDLVGWLRGEGAARVD